VGLTVVLDHDSKSYPVIFSFIKLLQPVFQAFKNTKDSWMWEYKPIIQALGRLRQENCKEANLSYTMSCRPP
jgi:hypothetical protein